MASYYWQDEETEYQYWLFDPVEEPESIVVPDNWISIGYTTEN